MPTTAQGQDAYTQQMMLQHMMRTPRSSGTGQQDIAPSSNPNPSPKRKAVRIPTGPPRLSPEPEDPAEAKRVRSKNRVRMHRYNQSLAAAAQATVAEEATAHEMFSSGMSGGFGSVKFPKVVPGFAGQPLMPFTAAQMNPQTASLLGGSDPIHEMYRQMFENQDFLRLHNR